VAAGREGRPEQQANFRTYTSHLGGVGNVGKTNEQLASPSLGKVRVAST